ncbi:MAG TPA: type I restriction enzyme endonuclease domain-containing protein [Chthoniobacterales bacterium]|nr:type I restriction enzyme endonuclease domain-containing protein [Chthoniobacterales bacterium]
MSFTESVVEEAALTWFRELGYTVEQALKLPPDGGRGRTRIFWRRNSFRAIARGHRVTRILRKHGYPPDLKEGATKTVLAQAEVLCADWVTQ